MTDAARARSIPADELLAFYRAIETRAIELVAADDPQNVFAGVVTYRASNGWTLRVFNDANEFDNVDEVITNDGRRVDFDELDGTAADWHLDDELAWHCLGIPPYCTFRCRGCGAQLRKPLPRVFLCGDARCVGVRNPPDGTWITVESGT